MWRSSETVARERHDIEQDHLNSFIAIVKLVRALLHILIGFFTILLVFPRLGAEQTAAG